MLDVTRSDIARYYQRAHRHKLPSTFVPNTPDLMREFIARAGPECLEMNTDVARRGCIALMRKPPANAS